MTLRLLDPGLYTLVVDQGRPSCRSLGVPVGGAADRLALAIGNALVGNAANTAALEVCLAGPTLTVDCSLACVLFGAPFSLETDRQLLKSDTTFTLHPGEELRIGSTSQGMRAYLCIAGGFGTEPVLGSQSGLSPLSAGAEFPCEPSSISARFVRLPARRFGGREPTTLRVLDGAQEGWFQLGLFYSQPFTVTPASNRMGLRLEGNPLNPSRREMISEPVCSGAVQVTRDGQCIILGVDGQTIGGYPKIAQVISADLDLLAQLRPGEQVCFERVNLEEATRLFRKRQAEMQGWVTRLRATLPEFRAPSSARAGP